MDWFFDLLSLIVFAYSLALLAYFLISFIKPAQSPFTQFLNKMVEPVLTPLRRVLANILPASWQRVDWSPVAAWLLIGLVNQLLEILRRLFT